MDKKIINNFNDLNVFSPLTSVSGRGSLLTLCASQGIVSGQLLLMYRYFTPHCSVQGEDNGPAEIKGSAISSEVYPGYC